MVMYVGLTDDPEQSRLVKCKCQHGTPRSGLFDLHASDEDRSPYHQCQSKQRSGRVGPQECQPAPLRHRESRRQSVPNPNAPSQLGGMSQVLDDTQADKEVLNYLAS